MLHKVVLGRQGGTQQPDRLRILSFRITWTAVEFKHRKYPSSLHALIGITGVNMTEVTLLFSTLSIIVSAGFPWQRG